MTSNPRDFRDWMKQVERQGVQLRGIPAIIQDTAEVIRDEVVLDRTRHPAAPVELTYQTAFYLDTSSRRRVRFLLDFPDVVFHTDGTAAQIQQYELWAKEETLSALDVMTSAVTGLALPGATLPSLTNTDSNAAIAAQEQPWTLRDTNVSSFFRADGFIPGTVWRFRARAIGTTTVTPGEWSEEIVVQMLADTTPPPMPTAPSLLVQRGTITVSWNGQAVSGAMPPDFKYAVLAHGTASSPTFEVARFGRGGGFTVVADIDYYDPQFFRLAAVDESGNMGPWSEQAVGYTTPLVDKDIIISTIDAAKTHLLNIDAGVSILPNTIITEHLVVTEEMTAAIANFLYVNADQIDVNSLAADTVFTGLLDAVLVVSDMFQGKTFTGGTFTTTDGGGFQTSVAALDGVKMTSAGISAWTEGGEQSFLLDAATGQASILGAFQVGKTADPHVFMTPNAWSIWPGIRFKTQNSRLDYQPTLFAIGADGGAGGWTTGDFVMMGGQDVANVSGRAQLVLGNEGAEARLQVLNNGTGAAGMYAYLDGELWLQGKMPGAYNSTSMFTKTTTSQTEFASGYFTINRTPPAYGIRYPQITGDGVAPFQWACRNLTAASFNINFSGPANNNNSFFIFSYWTG